MTVSYYRDSNEVDLYVRKHRAYLHRNHLESAMLAIDDILSDTGTEGLTRKFSGGEITRSQWGDTFSFDTYDYGHHWLSGMDRDELFQLRQKLDEARRNLSR